MVWLPILTPLSTMLFAPTQALAKPNTIGTEGIIWVALPAPDQVIRMMVARVGRMRVVVKNL
jgi:hypothetical protein